MSFGVFIHRTDSPYNDVPSRQYQFPGQYLSRAKQCEGDWIAYLEPGKVKNTKGYFAVARVQQIIPDPQHAGMYLAIIEAGTYLDFGDPVGFRHDGDVVEKGLLNPEGKISGRAQAAVRTISAADFARIIGLGLGQQEDVLPRRDADITPFEIAEAPTLFETPNARPRMEQLVTRVVRDRNFRKIVLSAYGERCAITGLRLINGGGRAEVEAAHIRPVEHDGPDIVSNGLALSGTAHWMFDRGLVGLSDTHEILVSRQANDADAVRGMINRTGHLMMPARAAEQPKPEFVQWHYDNCFKH
jgi:putative restriction endonuclease